MSREASYTKMLGIDILWKEDMWCLTSWAIAFVHDSWLPGLCY